MLCTCGFLGTVSACARGVHAEHFFGASLLHEPVQANVFHAHDPKDNHALAHQNRLMLHVTHDECNANLLQGPLFYMQASLDHSCRPWEAKNDFTAG